jgi:hypothetical protein
LLLARLLTSNSAEQAQQPQQQQQVRNEEKMAQNHK